jgi:putative toxin-antitoxin system antitoxin component (TIGR02293 family)
MMSSRTSDQDMEQAITYAVSVFGNKRKAMHWLSRPRAELHGLAPLDALQSPETYPEVMRLLGRIEHGIFA